MSAVISFESSSTLSRVSMKPETEIDFRDVQNPILAVSNIERAFVIAHERMKRKPKPKFAPL